MRLPNSAHTARPWRIHQFATDFELEDVWQLRTLGGRDGLPRLAALVRPNGALGMAYMAGIEPIRRVLVYPELIRSVGRSWVRQSPRATAEPEGGE